MKHVKSNVNILKPLQEKMKNNSSNVNLISSKSNTNIKNNKNNLRISEQEMKLINDKNNLLINFCEKTCKNSFSSLAFINNNKNIKNPVSPKKIISFNKNNKTSTNTIFNTNNNNYIVNNNNNSNRGINIRLNFKNKIINNNFSRKHRINKNSKKMGHNPHTPKNINLNSGSKPDFNLNEKIKEKDKQITLLQKDLLQSQKLLNQLQEEKQKEISSTYNSIKRVDSFINNNNSYQNNNINTNYNRMKKYSSLSNFFISQTDKNNNILRTFYGKSKLISNRSNSKRSIYNNKSANRIKNLNKNRKKTNLNIFTNPSTFAKFQIFKDNIQNKYKICKTRNNIHKNYNSNNFNSGSNSNIKKNKNRNFIRAFSYSPNKILAQFLYQYESNCTKNTFKKNINIKSTSPSSAQNRINNKKMINFINNKRSKDLDYIIKKGEDLKKRMKSLLNNYISLSYEIKKKK